jgi:CDP-diacylglycerol pyrophosphatase
MNSKLSKTSTLLLAIFSVAITASTAHADPLALWNIVNGKCLPDWQSNHVAAPCLQVDTDYNVAILKDLVGVAQVLAIPTQRITGIEDPQLLSPDAPDLFGVAWEARHFVFDRLGKSMPRDALGLAINSPLARSQNQAHIHVDCVQPEVRSELAKRAATMEQGWSKEPWTINGNSYEALRIDAGELRGALPFKLVDERLKGEGKSITSATIFVGGETFESGKEGFVLLTAVANPLTAYLAHGEDLLDHDCAIAKE